MSKKLYVGNLSFSTTEGELRELFEQYGTTESVAVITDRETGHSRGFGFVDFSEASGADAAISAMDGVDSSGAICASTKHWTAPATVTASEKPLTPAMEVR